VTVTTMIAAVSTDAFVGLDYDRHRPYVAGIKIRACVTACGKGYGTCDVTAFFAQGFFDANFRQCSLLKGH
jgi:hypothetical protein